MIARTWGCQNCRVSFDSYEANPPCPNCGCVRVEWVPGRLNIGGTSGIDKEVRSLADVYGMNDVNTPSPSRLNRAMPSAPAPAADGGVRHWGMGFSSTWSPYGATCVPCNAAVSGKVMVGQPLARSHTVDPIQAHTRIEARHIGAAK